VIAAVIVASLMPAAYHAWKTRAQESSPPMKRPAPEKER
jgi:hypothetical protein